MELAGIPGREFLLKDALKGISGYDYILIGCPPNLGILTLNALSSAEHIFIPMQVEFYALQALIKLLEMADVVKSRLNKNLKVSGVIATMYDGRKKLNREVLRKINENMPKETLFKTHIRDNVALAEASSHQKDIFEYKENRLGAEDYMSLSKEIEKKFKEGRKKKNGQ